MAQKRESHAGGMVTRGARTRCQVHPGFLARGAVPTPSPQPWGSRAVRMLPRHSRQTSLTASVQSSLGSLLPACSPCAARERGLGPHSPCVGGSTAAQPPGRQAWAVAPGPGPLSCRARGPWPLARGAGGRPALRARAARPPAAGIRARCCVHCGHGHSVSPAHSAWRSPRLRPLGFQAAWRLCSGVTQRCGDRAICSAGAELPRPPLPRAPHLKG